MRGSVIIATVTAVTLAVAGCYKLQPVSLERLAVREPPQVWVTTTDFDVVLLENPKVFGDTLVGQVNGEYAELAPGQWQAVRMRTQDKAKTLALVGGTVVGIGMAALLFSGTGGSSSSNFPRCQDEPTDPNCV